MPATFNAFAGRKRRSVTRAENFAIARRPGRATRSSNFARLRGSPGSSFWFGARLDGCNLRHRSPFDDGVVGGLPIQRTAYRREASDPDQLD